MSRLAGNALNLQRQIVVFVYCQWCILDREEERISRDEAYARIVGNVRLFRPRESWWGENKGWRSASGSSWIGWWKKNDDGKDLRDVKRYKEKNLTYCIKMVIVWLSLIQLESIELFPDEIYFKFSRYLENWKKISIKKIYLRLYLWLYIRC